MSLALFAVLASPAVADSNVTGVRTIDASILQAGDSFRVTVEMTIVGDNPLTGFGIAENLPSGWDITVVDNGGMEKSSVETKWLSTSEKSPGESFTIVYNVTVPSGTTAGTYSISGTVEGRELVNGTNVERESITAGDTEIEVTAGDLHIYPGDNFTDIITNATEGSTIYWHEGTYTPESGTSATILLPDNVHIIGDGADVVELQSIQFSSINVITEVTYESNSVLEGLSFSQAASATHLDLDSVDNVTIRDCIFQNQRCVYVTDSVVIENCTSDGLLSISSGTGGGIIRNNIFENYESSTPFSIDSGEDILITGNTFRNIDCTSYLLKISSGTNIKFHDNLVENSASKYALLLMYNSNLSIAYNTFENVTASTAFIRTRDNDATFYLNNFINCSMPLVYSGSTTTANWESPSAIDYTYQGSSYSSVLGNYYSDYTGEDADGNGIGDTAVTHALGTDSHPLMNAWTDGEVTSELEILYDDTVYLMETDVSFEASNSGSSYDVSERSDLGALLASGLNCSISDKWYAEYGSFYLVGIEGVEEKTWPGAGWGIYINDVAADYGLGLNDVEDGDVISFYYAPYDSNTYEQILEEATYVVHITVSDETPVEVVRTISTQTFNTGGDHLNTTTVTVTLTATCDIDSLNLIETIPSGWDFTISEKDGAEFRVEPDLDDSYEWVWADSLSAGESCTVEYLLEFPASTDLGTYELSGVASAYVDDVDVNDINVLGDSRIILEDDWNPWDDIGSDSDAAVTTAELKSAISLWCNSIPSPDTGAIITTDRLQYIIHLWLES
jgi:hypothetical protein